MLVLLMQFALGLAFAAPLYLGLTGEHMSPYVAGMWSTWFGWGAMWCVMKLYAVLRYGRGTRVSMDEPLDLTTLWGRPRHERRRALGPQPRREEPGDDLRVDP